MAGEAASLVVRITGDASQLEATISGVARSLQSLEKGGSGVSGSTQKAIDSMSKSTRSYADVVAGAKQQLDAKNTTLRRTQSEYDKTKALVDKNVRTLRSERDQVESLMKDQQKQIDRYEEMYRVTKKNSAAYKLNQEQLEKEHAKMKDLERDYNDLNGRIDYQNEILTKSQNAYKGARDDVNKASSQYRTLSANMAEVTRLEKAFEMQDTGELWQDVGQGIDDATQSLQAVSVATAIGGVAAAKFAIDFEDNFAAVKKTVDGTPEQLENIRQGIIDLTTVGRENRNPLPMTTAELTELAAAGGQLGIETENILDFTEVLAQLGTATNLVGSEGASQLARFMNVMNESQGNVRNVGSAVVDLGNNFATTEAEIMQMANRMGKYGNTVGISTADVLGYSAALSSLGIEAEMGGSAIGRTWLAIETAVATGGEELAAFAKYSNKSAEEFAEQWGTDASGAFMSLVEGLSGAENLTLALSEMGINNTLDIQAMMALANGVDLVSEALGRSNQAYTENTALQEEFDAKAETTASKLTVTKNNMVEAARGIGETMLPTITDMSAGVAEFAQKLAGLDEGKQKALVGIGAAIVGIGAGAKGLASVIESFGTIKSAIGSVKTALAALKSSSLIASLLTNPMTGAAAAAAALAAAGYGVYKAWDNYKNGWAERLGESSDDVREAADELARLQSLQKEVEDLQLVINSPESSTEQIEAARQRLQEIGELLNEEYSLNINVENADEVENAVELLNSRQRAETMDTVTDHISQIDEDIPKYIEDKATVDAAEEEAKGYRELATAYNEVEIAAQNLRAEHEAGIITDEEYASGIEELRKKAKETAEAYGEESSAMNAAISSVDDAERFFENLELMKGKPQSQLDYLLGDEGDVAEARKHMQEVEAVVNETAGSLSSMLVSSLQSGDLGFAKMVETQFATFGLQMKSLGMETDGVAQSFALAKNGFTEFDQAVQAGALGAVANDFISYQKSIGETTETAVQGAALLKNGFTDVSQAVNSVDPNAIRAVAADMKQLGEQNGIEMTSEKLTEMAQSMGLIDKNTTIEITAEGNIDVITEATRALERVNAAGNVELEVNTNGDISLLDTADEKLKALAAEHELTFEFNFDTGNFEVIDEVGNVLAEIDGKTGTVTFKADTTEPESYQPEDKEGVVDFSTGESPTEVPPATGTANFSTGESPAEVPPATGMVNFWMGEFPTEVPPAEGVANYSTDESPTEVPPATGAANFSMGTHPTEAPAVTGVANYTMGEHPTEAPDIHGTAYYDVVINGASNATGTKHFEGGLAMVNDQKNVADPRELIIDNGRAFIPKGRNVIIPLSKGAKVYTAAQTKRIAKRLGIPGFAGGTNNSDKNSDEFTAAREDLTHYLNTHAVTVSEELAKWVELSAQFTDNIKDAEDIEEEIYKLTRDRNEELNDESQKYIELRTAMNDWADIGDDPIAAFGRIRDRNLAELEADRLTWEEYSEIMAEAGNALYEGRLDQSYDWLEHQRDYNDMSLDDYLAGLDRMKAYTQEYLDQGLIDYKTYRESMTDIDEDYYDTLKERNQETVDAYFESADAYKEVRDTFDDWEDVGDSEIRYYTARLANIEKMFREGIMEPDEYYDRSREEYLALYSAVEDQQQELLDDFRENITEIEEQFRDEEQALRDSWDVEDRGEDLDEVNRLLGIYENAATDQGRQKYKDLLEQKKELEREEQLYRLEQDNNARLAELEEEYDRMEARKAEVLKNLRTDTFNIFANAETIAEDTSNMAELAGSLADAAVMSANEQTDVLYQILGALQGMRVNQTTYQDGRRITISRGLTESAAERLINGTIVSGMGTVMLYH